MSGKEQTSQQSGKRSLRGKAVGTSKHLLKGHRYPPLRSSTGGMMQHPLNRHTGSTKQDGGKSTNSRKSISHGSMTKVGEMIPFQRASRREPHVQSDKDDKEKRVVSNKNKMMRTKSSNEIGERLSKEPVPHNDINHNEPLKKPSIPSDTQQTLPGLQRKTIPTNIKQSYSRSVRPKQTKPSFHHQHPSILSSQRASVSSGASDVSMTDTTRSGEDQILHHSSTSPRRRIVKRKSQPRTAEVLKELDVNEAENRHVLSNHVTNHVKTSRQDNSTNLSHRTPNVGPLLERESQPSRTGEQLSVSLNPQSSRDKSEVSQPDRSELVVKSERIPISGSPLSPIGASRVHSGAGNLRHNSSVLADNDSMTTTTTLPRPTSSSRSPWIRNSSQTGDSLSRVGSSRATVQPTIATAIGLDDLSSPSPTELHETIPNSVRRSQSRSQLENTESSTAVRNRLPRASTTTRPRQREIIDVNAAVSVLNRRTPLSHSFQFESDSRTAAVHSEPQLNDGSNEEEVWIPRMRESRTEEDMGIEDSARSTRTTRTVESGSLQLNESLESNVVFRNSPVAPLPQTRHPRLSSTDNEETSRPAMSSEARTTPMLPNRRGLYRALSVSENSDISSISNSNSSLPNNVSEVHNNFLQRQEQAHLEASDHTVGEYSRPRRESRNRYIYQDRTRGRTSILNNSSSYGETPFSVDAEIGDQHNEVPPPDSPRHRATSFSPLSSARRDRMMTQLRQEESLAGRHQENGDTSTRRFETPPPTPDPSRYPSGERYPSNPDNMMEHLVLLASPMFGPLMLQASPAILFNMLSRARRDFGGEFVELLIENVVLSLLAQHMYDAGIAGNGGQNGIGAPPPASQETIDSLQKVVVTQTMVDKDEDASCAICHCEYTVDEVLDQLPCKHRFHDTCVTIWLKKSGTCPVCRHKLYTEVEEQ